MMAAGGQVSHEPFMRRALALARKGVGKTSPNPVVGAVIVIGGRVVAEGWHRRAGLAHAEVEALGKAPPDLRRATLYVTLEPCSHFGRTPPCADAVIRSGIKKVVIGMKDPNPAVSGSGIKRLTVAGVEVTTGVLEAACRALNEAYIKHITTGLPLVTLKLASSLDGRTATRTGESKWITGVESRRLVHRMRSVADAVIVGVSTVLADDPELTVRHVRGRNPLRAVLDTTLKTPLPAKVLKAADGCTPTLVFTTRAASDKKAAAMRNAGADVVVVPKGPGGVSIERVLSELGGRGVISVLVECGGKLAASFLMAGLADRFSVFLAPVIIGGDGMPSVGELGVRALKDARELEDVTVRRIGADVLVEGRLGKSRRVSGKTGA